MFYKIILRGLRILKNRQSSNFEDEIKKQLKFKNVFGRIKTHDNLVYADVMKLVDVPDSKSGVVHPTCRFDSGHRHFLLLFYLFLESNLRFLPLAKQYLIVLLGRVAIGIFYCFLSFFGVEPPVLTSRKTILNCFARQSDQRHFLLLFYLFFGVEPPVLTSRKTILNRFARQSGHWHFYSSCHSEDGVRRI